MLRYAQQGGSDRHVRVVARILEASREHIRAGLLDRWITNLELSESWQRAQEYVGRE
mgnify:CR=1 FL=1